VGPGEHLSPPPAPAALTDIGWDPATGSLWGSDLSGAVTDYLPGGALGPDGSFPVAGVVGCGLVAFELSSADPTPGTVAGLIYGATPACLPIPALGGKLPWVFPFSGPVGPFPVEDGTLPLTFTLPAGAPIGATVFMQSIVAKGSGGIVKSC
jgi:hypothetical protein